MDAASFKEMVLPLSRRIFPYALQMMKDQQEAEDVVQEIWTRLWEMRHKLDEVRNLEAFTFRMTRNYCLDQLKKKRPAYFDDREAPLFRHEESDPATLLETSDGMEQLRKIVEDLPEKQQTMLHMREVEGMEYSEIAEITGLEVNTIRVGLSRTRKKIREKMLKIYQT